LKIEKLYTHWWPQTRLYFFWLLVLVVIAERVAALIQFGFVYADSDQTIMWYAAEEMKQGRFHTLLFYGQNYNTHIEGLLAIPLLWMGLPHYMALPIVTNVLAIFPFLLLAVLLHKNQHTNAGIVILAIALALPTAFVYQTGLPRGFVTGIFLTSLGLPALFSNKTKWQFVAGWVVGLGYILNPNSVFVALPILGVLFVQNIKNIRFYLSTGTGLLIGGTIWFFIHRYYQNNPQLSIHGISNITFSANVWKESVNNLDRYFNLITPFAWKAGWLLPVVQIIPLVYLLYKKQYLYAVIVLLLLMAQIASLSVPKVTDGKDSIFFSFSRMYLGLPLLLGMVLYFAGLANKNALVIAISLAALVALGVKLNNLSQKTEELIYKPKTHVVEVKKVDAYKAECKTIDSVAKLYNAGLILVQSKGDYINYGCHCLVKGFTPTIRPSYERRRWVVDEELHKIHPNLIILEYADSVWQQRILAQPNRYKKVGEELYWLRNNTHNAIDVAKELNWYVGDL
jgi:hypothetical protein